MRILILTQYYPPEVGAPQTRLAHLAKCLAGWGHELTVLTAMPNYPQGQVYPAYRRRILVEEKLDGVRIIRTWIAPAGASGFSFWRRILSYFSFVFSSFILGLSKLGKLDVVVTESPPLFLGLSGFAISRIKRAPLVMNISD